MHHNACRRRLRAARAVPDPQAARATPTCHRQAGLGPSRATSGPHDMPNNVDLAPERYTSHATHARRPRDDPTAAAAAAAGGRRAPRTPPALRLPPRPSPTAGAHVQRPLRPLRPAGRPPQPARRACGGGAAMVLRRRPDLRQRVKRGGMSRGRAGREPRAAWWQQRWHRAAPTVASGRCMQAHAAFSHAARTSQKRPRSAAERLSAAAVATAATPGTRAVQRVPVAAAAARVEVPASTEAAPGEWHRGRDGADRALVRALVAAAHLRRCPRGSPTSARGAEARGGVAPDAKTALSRCHSVAAVESGWHRARRMTVTRTGWRHGG